MVSYRTPRANKVNVRTFVVGGLVAYAGSASADTLWSQPFDFGAGGAYGSQYLTNYNFPVYTTYDNFALSSNSQITGVDFTGAFFNPQVHAQISAFVITFNSNSSGQPGSVLLTVNVPGNANETYIGNYTLADIPFYEYNVSLDASFAAGTYWMSVVAYMDFPPQWGWATGTGGDGVAYVRFGNGVISEVNADLAFDIYGTPTIPEPATWRMMLLGLASLGVARSLSMSRVRVL